MAADDAIGVDSGFKQFVISCGQSCSNESCMTFE